MVNKMSRRFEWDKDKDLRNQKKHGVRFEEAIRVFQDASHVVIEDITHSHIEDRYFCLGKVDGRVLTVRFTLRDGKIRIFGAAYWRKGTKRYEQENKR